MLLFVCLYLTVCLSVCRYRVMRWSNTNELLKQGYVGIKTGV